ncbi:MAG: hypothetical protein PF569_00250 [Candidatus Woesearchaeota archaeon]|jgi:hypothetical protein|nr:hypothetical protein [Candidatus Woesearchaeota archaeon]
MKFIKKHQSGNKIDPYKYDAARKNYLKEKSAFEKRKESYNDSLLLYNYGQDSMKS